MYDEKNTGTNLPAQIEIYAEPGDEYEFLFVTKGGGSANKTFLFQETRALLYARVAPQVPRREDPHARHVGLPALPPRDRDRRHVGRVHAEDREAREHALPRHAADDRKRGRPRVPRRRARGGGAQADAADGDRRAVRRQVLLPRRARRPAAAPRRVLPGRARRLVLGRPPGPRQDHAPGRLPRAARDEPGEVPARGDRCGAARRRRRDRSRPPDGRDSRRARAVPGEDASLAQRHARRRARHRAREAEGAHRPRRRPAPVREGPHDLLRRPGEDAGRVRVGLVRSDDRRPHGLVRRPLHGQRRQLRDAREGQPFARP